MKASTTAAVNSLLTRPNQGQFQDIHAAPYLVACLRAIELNVLQVDFDCIAVRVFRRYCCCPMLLLGLPWTAAGCSSVASSLFMTWNHELHGSHGAEGRDLLELCGRTIDVVLCVLL